MEQLLGQLSLNDFFAESVSLGSIGDDKVGAVIPFQKLKDYIGKRVVYRSVTGSNGDEKFWNKVVMIKDYFEKSDTYYSLEENGKTSIYNEYIKSLSSKQKQEQMKPAFVCDRIAYSDDDRTKKTNSWLSEAFCTNGRHRIVHNSSAVGFYEYKAM